MAQDVSKQGPHCQALRKDGSPCHGVALPSSTFCFAHSPDHASARAEGAAKGGSHTKRSHRVAQMAPASLKPVTAHLFEALEQLHEGGLDPRIATAMSAVASAIVRCLTAGELEERVRALEDGQQHVNTR